MNDRFEDGLSPARRAFRRIERAVRGRMKQATGRPLDVLVELRWRLGDEIMALPLFESLKASFSKVRVSVLTNYPDLFLDHPYVDAVNPPNPNPDRYIFLREAPRQTLRIAHYAALAGVPVPAESPRIHYADWSSALLPRGQGPAIAIAPGASWPTKRWPQENWRALLAALAETGRTSIELGSDHDPICAGINLVGQTSVADAARVLHHCDLLIASDSGLMHLALAVGTPVLALFGPTDPSILIRDEPNLHIITNGRPCAGCWNGSLAMKEPGVCPLNIDPCLGTITSDAVAERARTILARES